MTHHIKKIINHKHSQTIFVLLVLAGLMYYFVNYKKSEASDFSPYIYDLNLQSSNASSTIATPGDIITYSFKLKNVLQKSDISYITLGNNFISSPTGTNCTYLNASGTTSVLQDTEILSSTSTPDLSCSISIITPNQNIINTYYYKQVYASVQVQVDPSITSSPQVENNSDDGSFVNYVRTATTPSSFFVDTVHIESTYLTDLTLATPTKMITLTYTMPEPVQVNGGVENQIVNIFGRTVEFLCEQPAILPSFLDLFIDTAYAQVTPGKVTCVATTTVTDLDIDSNISGYVVPFSIQNSFYMYLEENPGLTFFNYNISTTTDASFVRVLKEVPVINNPVIYLPGIIPLGLITGSSNPVIPQNTITEVSPEVKNVETKTSETVREVLGLTPEEIKLTDTEIKLIKKNKKGVLGRGGLADTGFDSRYSILLSFSLFFVAVLAINYIHKRKDKKS